MYNLSDNYGNLQNREPFHKKSVADEIIMRRSADIQWQTSASLLRIDIFERSVEQDKEMKKQI